LVIGLILVHRVYGRWHKEFDPAWVRKYRPGGSTPLENEWRSC
jgi:hypothetical protein